MPSGSSDSKLDRAIQSQIIIYDYHITRPEPIRVRGWVLGRTGGAVRREGSRERSGGRRARLAAVPASCLTKAMEVAACMQERLRAYCQHVSWLTSFLSVWLTNDRAM